MTSRSRRDTVRRLAILAAFPIAAPALRARLLSAGEETDDDVARRIFNAVGSPALRPAPMGEIVIAVARQFLGRPYRAHTLETPGEERLVMNLREFDCVTLVESTLAFARCIALRKTTVADVRRELSQIRYRNGVMSGYGSRLHYFTDWIADNEQKGIVDDVTAALGGVPLKKRIDFMTAHAERYPRLRDRSVREAIGACERALSARGHRLIPVQKLTAAGPGINNGDILGITTSIAGLDIVHTGFAVHVDGRLHTLHAPLSGGVVSIGEHPLSETLRRSATQTGIVVARPRDPLAPDKKIESRTTDHLNRKEPQ